MPSPILAATDFSPLADFAVERAARLARERQWPLHLLHVYNEFAWSNLRKLLREPSGYDAEAAARERLRSLASEIATRHGLPDVGSTFLSGRASVGIATQARELAAGLVVLGAHGEGIVRELALGGTAIKVLRTSSCPVLVVRREPKQAYARILTGTDFSATSARALRAAIEGFPGAIHAVINAYSVAFEGRMRSTGSSQEDIERYREEDREVAQRSIDAFVADANHQAAGGVQSFVRHGYSAAVLLDEAQRRDSDLLVVGKHGISVLDERLLGSVTLNVMHHALCDVLVVP